MTTPANPADLLAFLQQQFENQRFRAEGLKTLAHALPAETGAYLTETADLLLSEVDAKRRILAFLQVEQIDVSLPGRPPEFVPGRVPPIAHPVLRLMALPYADRPGYREEWRPA